MPKEFLLKGEGGREPRQPMSHLCTSSCSTHFLLVGVRENPPRQLACWALNFPWAQCHSPEHILTASPQMQGFFRGQLYSITHSRVPALVARDCCHRGHLKCLGSEYFLNKKKRSWVCFQRMCSPKMLLSLCKKDINVCI